MGLGMGLGVVFEHDRQPELCEWRRPLGGLFGTFALEVFYQPTAVTIHRPEVLAERETMSRRRVSVEPECREGSADAPARSLEVRQHLGGDLEGGGG